MNVKICDMSFGHAKYGWNGDLINIESKITWDRQVNTYTNYELCVFTDMMLGLVDFVNAKIKIALLIEPFNIYNNSYNFIYNYYNKFDYVLTHNLHILQYIPNGVYYPHGGTWINPNDWAVHLKTKNISIIASNKKTTDGQKLRHDIISIFHNKFDLICGHGYKKIDYKLHALKDYRASVIVENCIINDYFSEKLIDSFLTGVVPIYWNNGFIMKYFNPNGMLLFNDILQLHDILNIDIEEFYDKHFDAIQQNFELAKQYANTESWIYENFLTGVLNYD